MKHGSHEIFVFLHRNVADQHHFEPRPVGRELSLQIARKQGL
jgi:hypothetical protein